MTRDQRSFLITALLFLLLALAGALNAQRLDSVHIQGRHVTLYLTDTIAHVHPRGMGKPSYTVGAVYQPVMRRGRLRGYRRVR